MNDPFLQLKNVTKAYSGKLAVDAVDLSIPKGQIYGLLGPNGAGKTSIIRMITRITRPDSGEITFRGEALTDSHVRWIGYMPEERGLYKKMKVREQLLYLLQLKGLKKSEAADKIDAWLKKWDIESWAKKQVGELSKGMQQKVQFISTVAHEPELLILDEPFSGLDPINTQLIEEELFRLKKAGTTLIFSTHRMEQVEELCDRIALINEGRVRLEDDITSVRKQFQKNQYHLNFSGASSVVTELPGVKVLQLRDNRAMLELMDSQSQAGLLRALSDSGLDVLKFELHLPRLQEIFIEVVQGEKENKPQKESENE